MGPRLKLNVVNFFCSIFSLVELPKMQDAKSTGVNLSDLISTVHSQCAT